MAGLVAAQGRGSRSGGGDDSVGGANIGAARAAPKESKAEQVADRLKLNGSQKSEFNSILDETQQGAGSIVQQVLKCRQDLANALINGKSGADLAPLNQALADAEFQMTGVEVKAFQKIVALLKPNQMSRVPEAFELMAGIFLQPGRGRGGQGR
ncbi:MAG TPA: hypothetical protein VMB03_25945 [Bryobacteraceae bacterium]|nr:hypothetical protein [Bryobacteraceae bacterium]